MSDMEIAITESCCPSCGKQELEVHSIGDGYFVKCSNCHKKGEKEYMLDEAWKSFLDSSSNVRNILTQVGNRIKNMVNPPRSEKREYAIILVFNKDLYEILMFRKNSGMYKNLLNGFGCLIDEKGKDPMHQILGEVEKAGIPPELWIETQYIVKLESPFTNTSLWVYALRTCLETFMPTNKNHKQGELVSLASSMVYSSRVYDCTYAGNGEMPYLVRLSLDRLGKSLKRNA